MSSYQKQEKVDSSPKLDVIFKYYFEVEMIPRREDSHIISVTPSLITEFGDAIFSRDNILNSLERDNVNIENIFVLKYFDKKYQSWAQVKNEISVNLNEDNKQNSSLPQIIELLIIIESKRKASLKQDSEDTNILKSAIKQQIRVKEQVLDIDGNTQNQNQLVSEMGQKLNTVIEQKNQLENEVFQLRDKLQVLEKKFEDLVLFVGMDQNGTQRQSLLSLTENPPDFNRHHSLVEQVNQLKLVLTKNSQKIMPRYRSSSNRQLKPRNIQSKDRLKSYFSTNNDDPEFKKQLSSRKQSSIHKEIDVVQVESSDQNSEFLSSLREDSDSEYYYEEETMSKQMSSNSRCQNKNTYNADFKNSPNRKKAKKTKQKLDIVYLYSDPLVVKDKRFGFQALENRLDQAREFRELYKQLQDTGKECFIRKDAANFEVLKQILSYKPAIIHISCHGDYDIALRQYYLAFEQKDTGLLDKLTENRLKEMLGEENNHDVKLAFVSACHSEMIGRIFQEAKIPIVVAVNSHTMILDEVCKLFSRHFYLYLVRGYTPRSAFQEAQKVIRGSNIDIFSCCCAHNHKVDCKWENYAKHHNNDYKKAHLLHMPSCTCKYKHNIHPQNCAFYKKFTKELEPFRKQQDELDFDDISNLYGDEVRICCCQPEIPHDESIKYILYGEDKVLDTPIFKNKEDGEISIDQDVNQQNKLENIIDQKLLIGRNIEVQKVVQLLFSEEPDHRLIHVYGQEGLGKSAISIYSAKYTLERRKFCHGVYSVEVQNRNSVQGLISKICQKLLIQNCNKEQLCDIIKNSQILIIIDKCQQFIQQAKDKFNKTLNYLVNNTTQAKFLVISLDKDDLKDDKQKQSIQINQLSKYNAANLLFIAAAGSPFLKGIKTSQQIQDHKIFEFISYKPVGILQIAPLLFSKSLDQIVREREEQATKNNLEISNDVISKKINLEFEDFNWIMEMTFSNLQIKYPSEIKVLFSICQFQVGLLFSDIQQICETRQYGNWKKLLKFISQDEKRSQGIQVDDQQNKEGQKNKKQALRMITSDYNDEMNEHHYTPQPIVSEYINKIVLDQKTLKQYFQDNLKFLAQLSRQILRTIKYQNMNDIDLQCISCEIDIGIWKDEYSNIPMSEQEIQLSLVNKPELKFNLYESNFLGYLDILRLKSHFQQLDQNNPFVQYFDELSNNVASIQIQLNRLDEAKLVIEKTREIYSQYNLKLIKAKSLLILSSIQLKQNNTYELVQNLNTAQKIFLDLGHKDGVADACFLKGIALIGSVNQKFQDLENQVDDSFQVSLDGRFNTMRTTSFNLNVDLSKQMSLKLNSQFKSESTSNSNINLQRMQNIKKEIADALIHFKDARYQYKQAELEYGLAKVNLIESEFLIEKSYGQGLSIDYDQNRIIFLLLEALEIFKKLKHFSFQVKCLRNLGLLKFRQDEYFQAKTHLDDALKILIVNSNNQLEAECRELLNQILDRIRMKSNNVFIFADASPLVDVLSKEQAKVVGSITKNPQDFKEKIKTEVKKLNKVVNLRFDILSKDLFEYVKDYGCRILQLSSSVFNEELLCIEGQNGQIEYITVDQLSQLLNPTNSKLNIDLVVLAFPQSQNIAEAFYKMGVPHIVYFDFKSELLKVFTNELYSIKRPADYIQEFCVEFYKSLINQKSIKQSLKKAQPIILNGIKEILSNLQSLESSYNIQILQQDQGEGAILFPNNINHREKLFDSTSYDDQKTLEQGNLIDTSKVAGPTNIFLNKYETPFTGRQIETFKLLTYLSKPKVKLINVFGLQGIGKTRFVQEAGFHLCARYKFQDGIFRFDLKVDNSTVLIKEKLKTFSIEGAQDKDLKSELSQRNILLIFDNVDEILRQNKIQFDWFLINLVKSSQNLKIILISREKINSFDYKLQEKSIIFHKLRPLNKIEAVDMILSNCKRQITNEELLIQPDSKLSIHEQLQQEQKIDQFYGVPKYLEFFATYLKTNPLKNINIRNYVPKQQQREIKKLQRRSFKLRREGISKEIIQEFNLKSPIQDDNIIKDSEFKMIEASDNRQNSLKLFSNNQNLVKYDLNDQQQFKQANSELNKIFLKSRIASQINSKVQKINSHEEENKNSDYNKINLDEPPTQQNFINQPYIHPSLFMSEDVYSKFQKKPQVYNLSFQRASSIIQERKNDEQDDQYSKQSQNLEAYAEDPETSQGQYNVHLNIPELLFSRDSQSQENVKSLFNSVSQPEEDKIGSSKIKQKKFSKNSKDKNRVDKLENSQIDEVQDEEEKYEVIKNILSNQKSPFGDDDDDDDDNSDDSRDKEFDQLFKRNRNSDEEENSS